MIRRFDVVVRRVLLATVAAAAALAGPVALDTLEAQARGATRRSDVVPQNDRATDRQGRVLLDRFAQRAGRALGLTAAQTRRLQSELQASREARGRIVAQARAVRQELARLVRESSTDEDRMARLLDEAVQLDIRAAEVAADEQRRLAEFLTPTQRVRILWLRQRLTQEALRQRDSVYVDRLRP